MDSADRDREKAWKERAAARAEFPLPESLLQAMFDTVEAQVEEHGCDHSHRFTKQLLSGNQQPEEKVLGWSST